MVRAAALGGPDPKKKLQTPREVLNTSKGVTAGVEKEVQDIKTEMKALAELFGQLMGASRTGAGTRRDEPLGGAMLQGCGIRHVEVTR